MPILFGSYLIFLTVPTLGLYMMTRWSKWRFGTRLVACLQLLVLFLLTTVLSIHLSILQHAHVTPGYELPFSRGEQNGTLLLVIAISFGLIACAIKNVNRGPSLYFWGCLLLIALSVVYSLQYFYDPSRSDLLWQGILATASVIAVIAFHVYAFRQYLQQYQEN